ncbi:LOW QUALITY PROTEIN: hypothetical protein HID58_050913, partial [Brassica napus]
FAESKLTGVSLVCGSPRAPTRSGSVGIWVRSDLASTEEVGRASLPPLPFSVLACTHAALTGSSQGIFELLPSVSEKPAVLTTRRTSVISSIDDIHGVLTVSSHSFSFRSCHWLLGLEDNPLRSDAYCKKMELSIYCCLTFPSLLAPMNLPEYSLMFLPYVCVAWPEEESNYRLRLTSSVLQSKRCHVGSTQSLWFAYATSSSTGVPEPLPVAPVEAVWSHT